MTARTQVLLVEDQRVDAMAVTRSLRESNCDAKVYWVRDGGAALDYLVGRRALPRPLVVLLDLQLEEIDGQDVLNALGDLRDSPDLAVYVFTASAHHDDLQDLAGHHVAGVIVKQMISDDGHEFADIVRQAWKDLNNVA